MNLEVMTNEVKNGVVVGENLETKRELNFKGNRFKF